MAKRSSVGTLDGVLDSGETFSALGEKDAKEFYTQVTKMQQLFEGRF